jgi:hypothetical protein
LTTGELLHPTMENIRMELARRQIQYRELWDWADSHDMYMAYNQLTAYLREDISSTRKARERIAKMMNGMLQEKGESPIFDENPPDY